MSGTTTCATIAFDHTMTIPPAPSSAASSAASGSDPGAGGVGTRAATLDPHSDAALVLRAADGDVAAFGVLVERYQRPMAALVSRMTANPDDVDDVVQE